jgi:mRNA interferase MazF
MVKRYVPDSGDIVWLEFDPQAGHEQAGHRPALVLSPTSYNGKAGLILCCLLSTQIKGHPFEALTEVDGTRCVVLTDHLKSLDWRARKAKYKASIGEQELWEVRAKIKALLMI